jgi:hypothetical protein
VELGTTQTQYVLVRSCNSWEETRPHCRHETRCLQHNTGYCRQAVASRLLSAPSIRDTPPSGGQQSSLVWQVKWKPESGGGNWELYAAKPRSGRGNAIYTALRFRCLKIQQGRDSSVDDVIRAGRNDMNSIPTRKWNSFAVTCRTLIGPNAKPAFNVKRWTFFIIHPKAWRSSKQNSKFISCRRGNVPSPWQPMG